MKTRVALVKNIQRLLDAYAIVENAEPGSERMVLLNGATGTGKSTALLHLLNQTNGIYTEASPAWTLTSMYRRIMTAIGQEPRRLNIDMEEIIIDTMGRHTRPLFIDEIDHILLPGATTTLRMLEALRSIHDKSGMPIVMVGMDKIEQKLRTREQLTRRIFQWVTFTDLDRDDARIVADTLCDVPIADDWLDALFEKTKGRISYLSHNIKKARIRARSNRWQEINLAVWGGPLFVVNK
jgi:DNA transposition AAA+ family ATPase